MIYYIEHVFFVDQSLRCESSDEELFSPFREGQADYSNPSLPTVLLTYFFLGLVCDNALLAIDFDVLL